MFREILIFSFLTLLVASCYYDNEEELYGTTECSTENVTYSGNVLKIIDDNCYRCHDAANNFGGITLEGYDNLKAYADSGALLGVIKRESGYSPMPKNEPPLVTCDIEKIEVWIANGALNN
jgi:hypothetical protein